jgi:putative FmdB family regulatory protein
MPIYEYRCEDCGSKFEKLVRRSDDPSQLACPSCGKQRLQQELSTFAAHANGSPSKSEGLPPCATGRCPGPGMCGMG